MMGLSDSERMSITGSAVLTQHTRVTDYGIAVAYTHYSIGLLSRVKTSNGINFKKDFRHDGQLLRLPVYGRLIRPPVRSNGRSSILLVMFFFQRVISELPQPITAKLRHMIRTCVYFIN